jgi:hypothetical protein
VNSSVNERITLKIAKKFKAYFISSPPPPKIVPFTKYHPAKAGRL